jgi:hypothetical protein
MSEGHPTATREKRTSEDMLQDLDKSHWFSGIQNYDPQASLNNLFSAMGYREEGFKDSLFGNGFYTVPNEMLTLLGFHSSFKALSEKYTELNRTQEDGYYTETSPGKYEDSPIEDHIPLTHEEQAKLQGSIGHVEDQWNDLAELVGEAFKPHSELGSALRFGIGENVRRSLATEGGGLRYT